MSVVALFTRVHHAVPTQAPRAIVVAAVVVDGVAVVALLATIANTIATSIGVTHAVVRATVVVDVVAIVALFAP